MSDTLQTRLRSLDEIRELEPQETSLKKLKTELLATRASLTPEKVHLQLLKARHQVPMSDWLVYMLADDRRHKNDF